MTGSILKEERLGHGEGDLRPEISLRKTKLSTSILSCTTLIKTGIYPIKLVDIPQRNVKIRVSVDLVS